MIKSRSKWKSISETLSSEFNLLRIAKKIKTEEKENCTETLSSEFSLLRIAKKIKIEEKENCAWIKRKCKEKFYLIWNNTQRRQRIELAITECTKNEDSELVRSDTMLECKLSYNLHQWWTTIKPWERWENWICFNIYKYLMLCPLYIGSKTGKNKLL